MESNVANKAILMVGSSGGDVSIVSADGQVICTEGLLPGRYKGSSWVPFMAEKGDVLQTSGEVSVMVPDGARVKRMKYGPGATDTGANPDFVVTSATRAARELERKLSLIEKNNTVLERRMNQLRDLAKRNGRDIEVVEQEDVDVVDDDDNGDVGDPTIDETRGANANGREAVAGE